MSGTERTSRGAVVALLLLGTASGGAPGAFAQSATTPASPTPAAPASHAPRLSRAQVIALAQRRYAARVLRASLSSRDGRPIYVLLMLSGSGKVWTVHLDARSGQEVP